MQSGSLLCITISPGSFVPAACPIGPGSWSLLRLSAVSLDRDTVRTLVGHSLAKDWRLPIVSISLRDHKMLWGRAGARCAICRTPLATISEIGLASVIGEEAHIVARKQDGPRGNSPLSAEQRDSYSNLILLCPTHHATIDDIPNGPQEYTVERLHRIKAEHEAWVMAQDAFNAGLQLADEQRAALVDALDNRMAWDTWTKDISRLFSHEQLLSEKVYERLTETRRWIQGRIWPPGHTYLRTTIQTMGLVLEDLLRKFDEHVASYPGAKSGALYTEKFYKITNWDEKRYNALMAQYEYHTALVEDLAFELTRYGNLIAGIVRAEIDPTFRFEQGALLIRYGIDILWPDSTYRPEFSEQEIAGERQPYNGLSDYLRVRTTRKLSEASCGSPRTIAGRQNPETPPP